MGVGGRGMEIEADILGCGDVCVWCFCSLLVGERRDGGRGSNVVSELFLL
jgi:hypothetical protein